MLRAHSPAQAMSGAAQTEGFPTFDIIFKRDAITATALTMQDVADTVSARWADGRRGQIFEKATAVLTWWCACPGRSAMMWKRCALLVISPRAGAWRPGGRHAGAVGAALAVGRVPLFRKG